MIRVFDHERIVVAGDEIDENLVVLAERSLFDDLRDNRIRLGLRPEQELITFGWLKAALDALPGR